MELAQYRKDLRLLQAKLSEEHEALKAKQSAVDELARAVQHLTDFCAAIEGSSLLPSALDTGTQRTTGRRRRRLKKPDTHILEEILREHGPMHVTDLMALATERGVSFAGRPKKGKGPSNPIIVAVRKLRSSKRFHNFGGNWWGLPGQTLPHRNGSEQ